MGPYGRDHHSCTYDLGSPNLFKNLRFKKTSTQNFFIFVLYCNSVFSDTHTHTHAHIHTHTYTYEAGG